MAFLIDEANLPATLTAPPMTDEGFAAFCAEHPDLRFEMTAEGEVIVMAPTNFFSGAGNLHLGRQFGAWAWRDGRGVGTDSSTGFVLPNGARRSPDIAWTPNAAIPADTSRRKKFLHVCPSFVIELRSDSDRMSTLRKKMREWIANGAELGWLIDPDNQIVEVYRQGREPEILVGRKSIKGEGQIAGFVLDLRTIWNPVDTRPDF